VPASYGASSVWKINAARPGGERLTISSAGSSALPFSAKDKPRHATAQTSVLRAQVGRASKQGGGRDPQCRGGAVDHMPRASAQHLVLADMVVWGGGPMGVIERLAAVQLQLRSSPRLVTIAA
jgi:hypothetical protein